MHTVAANQARHVRAQRAGKEPIAPVLGRLVLLFPDCREALLCSGLRQRRRAVLSFAGTCMRELWAGKRFTDFFILFI